MKRDADREAREAARLAKERAWEKPVVHIKLHEALLCGQSMETWPEGHGQVSGKHPQTTWRGLLEIATCPKCKEIASEHPPNELVSVAARRGQA